MPRGQLKTRQSLLCLSQNPNSTAQEPQIMKGANILNVISEFGRVPLCLRCVQVLPGVRPTFHAGPIMGKGKFANLVTEPPPRNGFSLTLQGKCLGRLCCDA